MATTSYEHVSRIIREKDWDGFRLLLDELKNTRRAFVEEGVLVAYCLELSVPMDLFEYSLEICLELCHPFLNTFHLLERCKDPVKLERLLQVGENPNCRIARYGTPLLEDKIQEFCSLHRRVGHLDEELLRVHRVILLLLKYGADYRNTRLCNADPSIRAHYAPQLSLVDKFPLMITLCSARHVIRIGNRSELRWVPMDLLRTLLYTFL
jgi:hypothetical protein